MMEKVQVVMERCTDKKITLRYFISSRDSAFDSQVDSLLKCFKESDSFYDIKLIELDRINKKDLFFEAIKDRGKSCICHARGESAALFAFLYCVIAGSKLVVDVRGAKYEELSFFDEHPVKTLFKKGALRFFYSLIKRKAHFSCVSESLRQYLIKRYNLNRSRISVNPCIGGKDFYFDEGKRSKKRKELGIGCKDTVFIMVNGGNSPWQNIDDIIEKVCKEDRRLILLSKKDPKIEKKGLIWRKATYKEVPDYLCAADIGLLFRERNIVNKVACPIKAIEYICCGLYILSYGNVDFIREFILKYKYGRIIKKDEDIKDENGFHFERERISMEGIDLFSVEKAVLRYLEFYKEVSYDI